MRIVLQTPADQYLLHRLKQHFETVEIDFTNKCNLDPSNDVVVIDVSQPEQIAQFNEQGFRVIVTKFFDEILDDPQGLYQQDNCLYLYARNWFRMHSASVWTKNHYNYIRPFEVPSKFFLMMMNLQRDHRTRLFEATKPYHHCSLYSYVEHGHFLPNDAPVSTLCRGTSDQHRYNPDWYSQTAFSMVSEARVKWPTKSPTARFVTEKTFKPIAFQHPFIVYGTPGTLRYLHELGFETFCHLIDQSYDEISDPIQRLEAIKSVLEHLYKEYKLHKNLFCDSISKQKILHNYYAFFDTATIDKLWLTEVINPIKEFLHA